MLELIFGKAGVLLLCRQIFLCDIDHGSGGLELVEDGGDAHAHFVLHSLQSLFRLRQLRAPLTDERLPLAAVEQIVAEVNTERSEVVDHERNAVLIAIASEGGYIGD